MTKLILNFMVVHIHFKLKIDFFENEAPSQKKGYSSFLIYFCNVESSGFCLHRQV